MLEKSFGEKVEGIEYKDRLGAYAIIIDGDKVDVVKTSTGFFLLGGGIETDEAYEKCIIRERLEESGLIVEVKEFICKGDNYHWSDTLNYYMHSIGYFYDVKLLENLDCETEKDHELVWLKIEESYDKLFLEHQSWALRYAISLRDE
jgi:8-oxo-dGTP diphosphatase